MTDTFNLNEWQPSLERAWMPDNSARAERQQNTPDPGHRRKSALVGKKEEFGTDDNPNVDYPQLQKRIGETYVDSLYRDEVEEQPL